MATAKNNSSTNTRRLSVSTSVVDGNIETPDDSIRQEEGNQEVMSAVLKANGHESMS